MKIDTLIEEITAIHLEHFLPLQYNNKDLYKHHIIIRCFKDRQEDKSFYADVVICRGDTGIHEYIDGNFYYNGSGVGYGSTFKKALSSLLKKTKKSIGLYLKETTS
jgi:hypothetical protein